MSGIEYVEVVAYLRCDSEGGEWPDTFGANCVVAPLMTVAQHKRLLTTKDSELEQCKRDAERYRWLRERGDATQWMNILRFEIDDNDSLDNVIDTAMQAGG